LKCLGAATTGSKAELLSRLLGPAKAGAVPSGAAAAAPEDAKDLALRPDFDPKTARQAAEPPTKPEPLWAAVEAAALASLAAEEEASAAAEAANAGRELVTRAVREALNACELSKGSPPPQRCARLRANLGMPRCPRASSKEEGGAGEQQEAEEATWEWLAVAENAEKLRKVVDAWKADVERCAARLQALEGEATAKMQELRSFQQTLHASAGQACDVEETAPRFAKYGSKIEALVKHVQRLQREDSRCKIICFVQWEDLKRKISLALDEFGIQHLSLQGSVWARRAALMQFQYEEQSPRMLLLSLEESASGTNLTSSNHVIIVHPMEAATREEAVAFEMQAVGRVRRPGQQRKIHIWRFVTIGTIEQQITEEHQRELWQRQSAKILVTPCGELPESEGEEDEEEAAAAQAQGGRQDAADAECCATQVYMAEQPAQVIEDLSTQCYVASSQLGDLPETLGTGNDRALDETLPYGNEALSAMGAQATAVAEEPCCQATQNYMEVDATQCYSLG